MNGMIPGGIGTRMATWLGEKEVVMRIPKRSGVDEKNNCDTDVGVLFIGGLRQQ